MVCEARVRRNVATVILFIRISISWNEIVVHDLTYLSCKEPTGKRRPDSRTDSVLGVDSTAVKLIRRFMEMCARSLLTRILLQDAHGGTY